MHSTIDALAQIEASILNAFATKKQLVAVFFDLTKAYDTTWRMLANDDASDY